MLWGAEISLIVIVSPAQRVASKPVSTAGEVPGGELGEEHLGLERRLLRLIGQGAWPQYGVAAGCREGSPLSAL
jgi:hypothetical protein